MSLLAGLKSKGLSFAAKSFLQKHVEDYGKISELDIDVKTKEIHCSLDLKGEIESVKFVIRGVRIVKEGEQYFGCFDSLEVSRQWINLLAQKYLPPVMKNNQIEVPDMIGKVLMKIFGF